MKLKLEDQEGLKILQVLESVTTAEGPVLRAGALKLLKTPIKCLILDLSAAKIDPGVMDPIRSLKSDALSCPAFLFIAGSDPSICDAVSREEAIKKALSPLQTLILTEAQLKVRVEGLQKTKADLEAKLKAVTGPDLKVLRKENTALKRQLSRLEGLVRALVQGRTEFGEPSTASGTRASGVDQTLSSILTNIKLLGAPK